MSFDLQTMILRVQSYVWERARMCFYDDTCSIAFGSADAIAILVVLLAWSSYRNHVKKEFDRKRRLAESGLNLRRNVA